MTAGFSLGDLAGMVGAITMLAAYGAVQARRLDPHGVLGLMMNLVGSGLVLASLLEKFNLASFVMELAWALIALAGLARVVFGRVSGKAD